MSVQSYAKLSNDGKFTVVNVELADEEFVNNSDETYVLNSGKVRRAQRRFIYDESRNGFYEPQPTPEHSLDETTLKWIPPDPSVEGETTYIFNREYWIWAPESPGENYVYDVETNKWIPPDPSVEGETTYIFNREYWIWAPESPGENYIYNKDTNEWDLPS